MTIFYALQRDLKKSEQSEPMKEHPQALCEKCRTIGFYCRTLETNSQQDISNNEGLRK